MRLLYKNTMISSLIIALSLMIVGSHLAQAQCTTVASCNTLGFDKDVSKCDTTKPILKCPSDTSKVFCVEKPKGAVIGDIYYSDGTFSSDVVSGKTAIGVVFDATNKLVVALEDAPSKMVWDNDYVDIEALTNHTKSDTAIKDMDGKNNTHKIVAQRGAQEPMPAAQYCDSYRTAGTNKGQWFLPALGQIKLLSQGRTSVNKTLGKLGKYSLTEGTTNSWYWSSSENDKHHAFSQNLINGGYTWGAKSSEGYVRPVLAF